MAEFHSLSGPLPHIPDDLSIPQFFLSDNNPARPTRPKGVPWLINDNTGSALGHAEISQRTRGFANAMSSKWNIGMCIKANRACKVIDHLLTAKGDTVCIFSPNNIAYPVCVWATHTLSGIITPANPAYKSDELVHQLRTSKAALLIIHPAFLNTARTAAREVGLSDDRIIFIEHPLHKPASDHLTVDELVEYGLSVPVSYTEIRFKPGEAKTTLAFLSFSSGTTGKPKAVAIPHYSVIANVMQMVTHTKLNDPSHRNKQFKPGDIAVAVLPFFHIYGLVVNLHFCLFAGLSVVVVPKFSFTAFLESIIRYRITHLFIVPPQVVLLCKHPSVKDYDFSHVKYLMCGAAPLSGDLVQKLCHIFPNASIGQGYGLTETCTTIGMLPMTQKIGTLGSAGQLLPGIVAKVVKEDGTLAKEGEQGELVVKGPSMALYYLNNEAAYVELLLRSWIHSQRWNYRSKETFVDGWVRTGDEVILKNGDLYIVDRLKEIMKVRGFQVAPAELEGHLLSHSDVTDACVVSIPDDYSGELPFAFVVLSEAAARRIAGNANAAAQEKATLAKYVADAKVHYKHLAGGIEFIETVPKNPSGKILRRILRDEARKSKASNAEIRAKL
ncbi:hypothetical protein H0H87_004507 [Tephrocybe sp. NHM501043]|nr:hypothetical protein H0H87_004507 [Tephrocybe sp. NHM501043]